MDKIHSLLKDGGITMLATTIHEQTHNEIISKTNFTTPVFKIFRRHYSQQDFEKLFVDADFQIIHEYLNSDPESSSKQWSVIVSRKP